MDFSIWNLRKTYTLKEAAHFFFNRDPNENKNEMPSDVMVKIKGMYGVLEEAREKGEIRVDRSGRIAKNELRAFAMRLESRPAFLLFLKPEKENGSIPKKLEPDIWVRKLRVSCEGDSEIKMQEPGKKAKVLNRDAMGFGKARKQWEVLLQIFKENGIYKLPASHIYNGKRKVGRTREYDRERDYLDQVSKKLICFLENNYGIKFPLGYKLYEKYPLEGTRVYKLKFNFAKMEITRDDVESQGPLSEDWKGVYQEEVNQKHSRPKKFPPMDNQDQ